MNRFPIRPEELQAVLGEIERQLRTLRYGSVEIVVHDGRVARIERRESVRIEPSVVPARHDQAPP